MTLLNALRALAPTAPFLQQSGGKVLFCGEGGAYLIGKPEDRWDMVLLVQHASVADSVNFASDPGYRAGLGHGTAALQESRLPPITQSPA